MDKPHKFTELVSGLKEFYQPPQMKDISVAFCFICLLHLANEQNLTIQPKAEVASEDGQRVMTELVVEQDYDL